MDTITYRITDCRTNERITITAQGSFEDLRAAAERHYITTSRVGDTGFSYVVPALRGCGPQLVHVIKC